jgi:CheY-like chemotaxis protein
VVAVLVVDDDPTHRVLVGGVLADGPTTVEPATPGTT